MKRYLETIFIIALCVLGIVLVVFVSTHYLYPKNEVLLLRQMMNFP
jgi:hypothetical protein